MRLLNALRRHYYLEFVLWRQFKLKAGSEGYTTNEALARLVERYLTHGFEDGRPESKWGDKRTDATPQPASARRQT